MFGSGVTLTFKIMISQVDFDVFILIYHHDEWSQVDIVNIVRIQKSDFSHFSIIWSI